MWNAMFSLLCCLLVCEVRSRAGSSERTSPDFEAFKTHLSNRIVGFELRFQECAAAPASENANGVLMAISESCCNYQALCQQNGFSLVQGSNDFLYGVPNKKAPVQFLFKTDYGFYDDLAWLRSDSSRVRVDKWIPAGVATNYVVKKVMPEYKKVWSVYYLGLPRLKPDSIQWSETRLSALTDEGARIQADFSLDPVDGKVTNASYSISAEALESGNISYLYERKTEHGLLPTVLERQILARGPSPEACSYKIRILELKPLVSPLPAKRYLAPVQQSHTMISNAVEFVNMRGRWRVPDAIHNMHGVVPIPDKTHPVRWVLLLVMGTSLILSIYLVYRKSKTTHL